MENDWEKASKLAQELKELAIRTQCPVFVEFNKGKEPEIIQFREFTITNSRTGKSWTTYYPKTEWIELGEFHGRE